MSSNQAPPNPAPAAPAPSLSINFPNGDTVGLTFQAHGNSTASTIDSVDVTQNNSTVNGVNWTVIQHPDPTTTVWIIRVGMPAGSSGDFELTVTDSDSTPGTALFTI